MEKIFELLEDIVTLAELQEEFYEVEAMVCVRRRNGADSDFIRMELDVTSDAKCRVTTKSTRPSGGTMSGLAPAPEWF